MYFDAFNHLDVDHKCDRQIDERTDFIVANTSLNYVARRKAAVLPQHFTAQVSLDGTVQWLDR